MTRCVESLERRCLLSQVTVSVVDNVVDQVGGTPGGPPTVNDPTAGLTPTIVFTGVTGTKKQIRRNLATPATLTFYGPPAVGSTPAALTVGDARTPGYGGVFARGVMFEPAWQPSGLTHYVPTVSTRSVFLGSLDASGRVVNGEMKTTVTTFIQKRREEPRHGSNYVLRMRKKTYRSVFRFERVGEG
jgi:hypothetical protein